MTDPVMEYTADGFPIDPASGRPLCTAVKPMPAGDTRRWAHESVEEVGDQEAGWPGGDIVMYRCSGCGHSWKAELPQ